ncbi:MAG: aspartate kinase [Bacteroidia bacterium]|nr:aspartate kinase [Bacteroidia bacterium]MCF8427545.1 aspartate kinase [Bacteroidia bacterium]
MRVFKFGGASVKNADAVRNVGTVLQELGGEEVLVIVSAMGKTTNSLELLAKAFYEGDANKHAIYKEVKKFHDEIINGLLISSASHTYDDIENLFIELECELENTPFEDFDQVYDQIVSYGEIFSSRILSAYLNESGIKNRWMDAQNFISTDNTYREGKVDWDITSSLISKKLKPIVKKQMVVTQGFIGRNKNNFTVTLGREGSDYTAAIFAYGLDAESVTIWKDVAGVMNADPKKFPEAEKIDFISYPRAIEMAYYGATVIHPKTIQPLQSKHIPLYVKSFLNPKAEGTVVGVSTDKDIQIPIYIVKGNQLLMSVSTNDFSFIVEDNLSKIFEAFAKFHVKINLMQNSAISFSICVENEAPKVEKLLQHLSQEYAIETYPNVDLFTITNFKNEDINTLLNGREILIERKVKNTLQLVIQ